ncbi:MAG: O-antigen ligase family protein [Candidatus Omnitrophota bacterium]
MVPFLLILIFIRPFISSLAFPEINLCFSFLLLLTLGICLVQKKNVPGISNHLKLALNFFFLALCVSLVFSADIIAGVAELYKYITAVLILITVSRFDREERENTIRIIALSGLIVSIVSIYQYFFGFQHLIDYLSRKKINDPFILDIISRKRVFFPFVTPNTLAGFLVMVIPLTMAVKSRWLFLVPMLAALLLTKSLSGLFCLLLALGLYSYLRVAIDRKKIIFLIGIAVAGVIVLFIRSNAPGEHTHPLFSSLMRWNYWKQTFALIKSSPFTGTGIGNFNLNLSRYAHNSYLQIWAEMGLLSVASFLWMVFLSFRDCANNSRRLPAKSRTPLAAGLMAASAAFLIHNLIDFSFFLPEVSLFWWVILGLMSCAHLQ